MDIQILYNLCEQHFGQLPIKFEKIPQSGSDRQYIRLCLASGNVIGVYNPNVAENLAFINLAKAFKEKLLPVPEIYSLDSTQQYYLCSDHGNILLFNIIEKDENGNLTKEIFEYFSKSLQYLVGFQMCGKQPDFVSLCNDPKQFDRQSITWDLNYFKYNFLKLSGIVFNEYALENEFENLTTLVNEIPLQGFMYRDFQSRNILIDKGTPIFIDFQGGRRGPLQYDVVSLLWQARANLSATDKQQLINIYLNELEKLVPNSSELFLKDFNIVVLLRLLQVLGAYGFRGLFERKSHFLKSIPYAITQLKDHWKQNFESTKYPELNNIICQLAEIQFLKQSASSNNLIIHVSSFSFLNGSYPVDLTGHGGGYVFDCRGLPNPGRLEGYKQFTGRDQKVIDYLRLFDEVQEFIDSVYAIIEKHAKGYILKNYGVLNVFFGCTGGQQRSIYCAERINKRLNENGYKTNLWHREFPQI